ncbi:MAG: chloride channel protein, partial [Burkholderiales bacterium]|nr:chloride channel protein [Burkholderiales bacterium]
MPFLNNLRLLALERLRLLGWQNTLVMAAIVGTLGALCTIGFRELILLAERVVFGRSDGLVKIAASLLWWQRLIAPALGGVVAGLILYYARKQPEHESGGDYMEAIAIGDGDLGVRASVLRALSSLASVATG